MPTDVNREYSGMKLPEFTIIERLQFTLRTISFSMRWNRFVPPLLSSLDACTFEGIRLKSISEQPSLGVREIIVHNYSHKYWCFSLLLFPFFFAPFFFTLYFKRRTPLNFNYYVTKGYKRYREAIRYGIVIFGGRRGGKEKKEERKDKGGNFVSRLSLTRTKIIIPVSFIFQIFSKGT